jgi:DNA polymerase-3 subunit epsilon
MRPLSASRLGRRWLAWRAPPGPLRDYYDRDLPASSTPYDEADFLAIDLETTGLDPETDEILSIGYVPIVAGRIRLLGAAYHLVRPLGRVPEETAVIHGLLDDALATAPPLAEAIPRLLAALAGRVAIAHHSRIERQFLSAACCRLYGRPLVAPFICTLALERRALVLDGRDSADGDLRLAAVRARYGLPRYRAHNALVDALAAAELFLAQAARASGVKPARLASLLG